MGYAKIQFQPKDKLPASIVNAMQDAIIENENEITRKTKIVTGSYSGTHNNYYNDSGEVVNYGYGNWNEIDLGFRPKSVIISDEHGRTVADSDSAFNLIQHGGIFLSNLPLLDYKGTTVGEITDNGFRIRNGFPENNNRNYCFINDNGTIYYYQVFA